MMNKSPAVILTCQFTLPNKKSFSTYIDYMTREKALEEMERRTPEEEQELQRIKNALEDFYIPEGENRRCVLLRNNEMKRKNDQSIQDAA